MPHLPRRDGTFKLSDSSTDDKQIVPLKRLIQAQSTDAVASYGGSSPSQNSFLIFTSVWTILALIYLAAAPRFLVSAANVLVLMAVELLTSLFWFAGFIAYAVFHSNLVDAADYFYIGGCDAIGSVCGTVEAAVVFGALEWALFVVTTVLAGMAVMKSRRNGTTTAAPVVSAPSAAPATSAPTV